MKATALVLTNDNANWLTSALESLGEYAVVYNAPGIGVYGQLRGLPAAKQPDGLTPAGRRAHAIEDLLARYPDAATIVVVHDPGIVQEFNRSDAVTFAAVLKRQKPATDDVRSRAGEKIAPAILQGATYVGAGDRRRYRCDVIIPFYRAARWLPQAIDAILTQTSVDPLVHVINDGCAEDDDGPRREFAGEENVRWYHNPANIGPYQSVHRVWSHLDTEFFAVQDADDIPLPTRLWRGVHALTTATADFYAAAMEQFAAREASAHNRSYAENSPHITSGRATSYNPRGSIVHGTLIARRSAFAALNGYMGGYKFGCDGELAARAYFAGCRLVIDSTVVAIRRVHDGGLSRGGEFRLDQPTRQPMLDERKRRLQKLRSGDRDFRALGSLDQAADEQLERIQ